MALAVDVVKRRPGQRRAESFDADKLLRSIRSACLSVRCPEGEAESTANRVTSAVILWVNSKPAITSHDIRRVAGMNLERFHTDAAYIFLNQRSIL